MSGRWGWRAALGGAAMAAALGGGAAWAQLGDPRGPGQSVPQPPPLCPQTIACTYHERTALGTAGGYRFQALEVCGANCTTQYWASDVASGKTLLTIDPTRGAAIVVTRAQANDTDTHPDVRVIGPSYAPNDPACCPSAWYDTTYSYDAASNTLNQTSTTTIPAAQFAGFAEQRAQLEQERFFPVFD